MQHQYTQEELRLAREIAETLNDLDSLPQHLKLVRKYNESYLRKKLAIAMGYKDHNVTVNRAAIYMGLIKNSEKYGGARY